MIKRKSMKKISKTRFKRAKLCGELLLERKDMVFTLKGLEHMLDTNNYAVAETFRSFNIERFNPKKEDKVFMTEYRDKVFYILASFPSGKKNYLMQSREQYWFHVFLVLK